MPQKGEHTWDLVLQYHQCPACGFIVESRLDYEYQLGKYVKALHCDRCGHPFSVEKKEELTFGPLIGEPQPIEWDWSS